MQIFVNEFLYRVIFGLLAEPDPHLTKKMENHGNLPSFWDLFLKTHRLKDSYELCSQQAKEIERVLARAEELCAEGEDPDYDAIFLELFGRVKKRKQVPGAGQVTSLYFPFATSSAAGSASSGSSCLSTEQVDELLERRVQPLPQEIEELRELVKVLSRQVQASSRV
ncbi:uncharacterized protein LOC121762897 isoform X2 [Salvia splendens]|uniref:uncharacterized protein LOC121762897 isoform X2 n=1 Tax=Salvia splendens TaxID=180675 RepID=UPI001C273CF4|nr:uncharacterized protein LOC121762897 isoform X2 [Salvia splendens]XP_042014851.1 uncharacterized protein LOC121762897 isoform X2 [Salvia splendens]